MHKRLAAVAALAITATLAFPTFAAADASASRPRYRIEALDLLPGNRYGGATAINNAGAVVGWSASGDFGGPRQAFLWRDGRLQNLGSLGGGYSEALGLNERGDVVGQSSNAAGRKRPFLWRDGHMQDVAASLGAGEGRALDVNAAGQVVGDFNDDAFHFDGERSRQLELGFSSLATAINDEGVIVGGGWNGGFKPFVLRQGAFSWLPTPADPTGYGADADHYAQDINQSGQVLVNRSADYDHWAGAYVWNRDHYEDTFFAAGGAWDMNGRGWVVGASATFDDEWGDYTWEPALYREGGAYLLESLLRPADAGRWELNEARGINDAGQIVGSGWYDGALRPYVATPVPEPAHAALLLAGLGVVGAAARTRRRELSVASGPTESA